MTFMAFFGKQSYFWRGFGIISQVSQQKMNMKMSAKISPVILLIFLPNVSVIIAFDAQNYSYGEMLFQRHSGIEVQLPTNVKNVNRKIFEVPNEMSCCFKCFRQSWCHSANFKTSLGINGLHMCEVLSTDMYSSPREYLKKSKEYVHLTVEALPNNCKITPCLNGGKCILDDKRQGYRCQCKEEYAGEKCQKELRGLEKSQILRNHGSAQYLTTLSSYLAPVLPNPSTSRWVRCWHAASDGWDVTKTFHPQCDGKGPTVTIVRVGKFVFGGYSDVSWDGTHGAYSSSTRAFLFSLYNTKGYHPVKIQLTGYGNQFAIFRSRHKGPTFGGGPDLQISNLAFSNQDSLARCSSYQTPLGCLVNKECPFYAGSGYFTPSDVEVFYDSTK